MSWFTETADGFRLAVYVQPGAKHTEIAGTYGERLKLRIAAPPMDGRANEALSEFLAAHLNLPRAKVRIVRGEHSRNKLVEVLDKHADPARLLVARKP